MNHPCTASCDGLHHAYAPDSRGQCGMPLPSPLGEKHRVLCPHEARHPIHDVRPARLELSTACNQRERDLLRYCRGELLTEGLITQEEFVKLLTQDGGSAGARRLEDYDGLRRELTAAQARVKELEAREDARWRGRIEK